MPGKRSSIEDGKLRKRGKTGTKAKKKEKLFKTTNEIEGATMYVIGKTENNFEIAVYRNELITTLNTDGTGRA